MATRKPGDDDIPLDAATLMRFGTVKTVDLEQALCTVEYGDDDDSVESQPIPWMQIRAGNTRTWSPPSIGEQGLLVAPDGEIASAFFIPGLSRAMFPPAGNSPRELIEYEDGAVIAYDPEAHKLEATLPAGATIMLTADGGLTMEGPVTINGDVAITGAVEITGDAQLNGKLTASDDVIASGKSLKGHKHLGVTVGGGVSGVPQ